MRFNLTQAGFPAVFHESAWENWEDARNMRPSKNPPHDCALGRLLKVKPGGKHLRPYGLFGLASDAERLPSGTLVNKAKPQASYAEFII